MTVLFDAATGRLRLDRESFDLLAGWARGDTPLDRLADLCTAGVVSADGAAHPAVAAALTAIRAPICTLRLAVSDNMTGSDAAAGSDGVAGSGAVAGSGGVVGSDGVVGSGGVAGSDGVAGSGGVVGSGGVAGDGWIYGDAAAVLLDLPGGLGELVTVHPTFLPALLARVVKLGPRPVLPVPSVEVPAPRLAELVSPDDAVRDRAADRTGAECGIEAVAHALGSGLRRRWDIAVSWPSRYGGTGRHSIRVLDTRAGLWSVEPADDQRVRLWPITSTRAWHALVQLLPTSEELAADQDLAPTP